MTDEPDFRDHRALGHARIEFAELLFQEAPDVGGSPTPSSELSAQVQAAAMLAIYYELRHGHDLMAAHSRALESHRLALAEYTTQVPALTVSRSSEPELPPAREPVD